MSVYQPVLPLDLSGPEILSQFNTSSPKDWTFDQDAQAYALKRNAAIRVVPVDRGDYRLLYRHAEIARLAEDQVLPRLSAGPA